jgi:hypothetical protein
MTSRALRAAVAAMREASETTYPCPSSSLDSQRLAVTFALGRHTLPLMTARTPHAVDVAGLPESYPTHCHDLNRTGIVGGSNT